jgi:hypothetical protein
MHCLTVWSCSLCQLVVHVIGPLQGRIGLLSRQARVLLAATPGLSTASPAAHEISTPQAAAASSPGWLVTLSSFSSLPPLDQLSLLMASSTESTLEQDITNRWVGGSSCTDKHGARQHPAIGKQVGVPLPIVLLPTLQLLQPSVSVPDSKYDQAQMSGDCVGCRAAPFLLSLPPSQASDLAAGLLAHQLPLRPGWVRALVEVEGRRHRLFPSLDHLVPAVCAGGWVGVEVLMPVHQDMSLYARSAPVAYWSLRSIPCDTCPTRSHRLMPSSWHLEGTDGGGPGCT